MRLQSADMKRKPQNELPCDAILASISDGVFTVDREWRITSFNCSAERITGVSRADAIGRLCSEVLRADMCEERCALRRTLETGRPVIGRSGYIVDTRGRRIPISVSTAVLRNAAGAIVGGAETFRDLSEVEALRQELEERSHIGGMISHSPLMRRIFDILPAVAASPSTVLITGETGTGKELLARTIHAQSPRLRGPFVAVNCGALPDTLLESELFGYKAGAFTGANRDKPGRFALARGGTLFLDEIGEISPALQVRLLRVLQDHTFEPLGAIRSEETNTRIVTATHRDLTAEVRAGRFREDLYYRIHVLRLELPPLRRRKEDIPLLLSQFVARFNRLQGKDISGFTPAAMALIMAHDWPGNIRELENVVERSFILCAEGKIGTTHLPEELTGRSPLPAMAHNLRTTRAAMDAQAIRSALEQCQGNRLAAARMLGIHKSTLFRRMKQLGWKTTE